MLPSPRSTFLASRWTRLGVMASLALLACSSAQDSPSDAIVKRSPAGGRAASLRPSLQVTLRHPSPSAAYYFQLATDSAFAGALESGPVRPESLQVSWRPPLDLEVGQPYYWRVGVMDGGDILWDSTLRFSGGPPLGAFPNPFCCKWAKSHKAITFAGMVPPARLQIATGAGAVLFDSGILGESAYAWGLTDDSGQSVSNGAYRAIVDDRLGRHELQIRITRPD